MKITIPKNIDIKARIIDFESQNEVSNKFKDKVYYFLSRIFINNSNRENYKDNYVRICYSEMKKKIGVRDYKMIKKMLLNPNDQVVEVVANFSTGKHNCKGFRIREKYNDGEMSYREISDKFSSKPVGKGLAESLEKYQFMFDYFDRFKLNLDSEVYLHIKKVAETLLMKVEERNVYQESLILDKIGYWLYQIERFEKGEYNPKVSDSNHRLNSVFSEFPRILRRHVRCNMEPLVGIDIKCSQPFLLACTLKSELNSFENREFESVFWKNITPDEKESIRKFIEISFEMDFYIQLLELAGLNDIDLSGRDRERVKKDVMLLLFEINKGTRSNNLIIKLFKSIYPGVNNFIEFMLNKLGGDGFAIFLQKKESDLLINTVSRKFNNLVPQAPLFPIHDCLFTTCEFEKILSSTIQSQVFEMTGKHPGMSFEYHLIDSEFVEKEIEKIWKKIKPIKTQRKFKERKCLIFQCNINRAKSFLDGFKGSKDYSEAA
ncbi:MAG TPA: hypothetical protein VK175_16850 [Leadbetterella sp.]|nr:hypothetical protein [Leadbetterella sp.]